MKVSRRTLLKASAATAVLGRIAAPHVAHAQAAEFSYKIGTSTPAAHPFNKRLQEVGDRIAKDSKGRMAS